MFMGINVKHELLKINSIQGYIYVKKEGALKSNQSCFVSEMMMDASFKFALENIAYLKFLN